MDKQHGNGDQARKIAWALNKLRGGIKPAAPNSAPAKPSPLFNATVETKPADAPQPAQYAPQPAAAAAPMIKKGSAARFLFSPQIGLSLDHIGSSLSLLTRTFASLLASAKLIPADHPATTLRGAPHYNVTGLMMQARHSLKFERAYVPQLVMYFSLLGFLLCGVLSVGLIIAKTAFGAAWAQPGGAPTNAGTFSGIQPNADYATYFINTLFDNNNLFGSALGKMLGMYSTAMLVFGGIILLYIIISAVMETARTGVPFGKQFNSVWAPIRLIVAIGLLVPLTGGMNSGQHIVLNVAKWGSEQATNVWKTFSEEVISPSVGTGGGAGVQQSRALSSLPISTARLEMEAHSAFKIALCQALVNQLSAQGVAPSNLNISQRTEVMDAGVTNTTPIIGNDVPATTPQNNQVRNELQYGTSDNQSLCGAIGTVGYRLNAANVYVAAGTAGVNASQAAGLQQLMDIYTANNSFVNNFAASIIQSKQAGAPPLADILQANGVTNFNETYKSLRDAYIDQRKQSVSQSLIQHNDDVRTKVEAANDSRGWMNASTWLNAIADQNGQLINAVNKGPDFNLPNYDDGNLSFASEYIDSAENYIAATMPLAQAYQLYQPQSEQTYKAMSAAFGQMLLSSNNPLSDISGYGRYMLTSGLKVVTEENAINCLNDTAGATQAGVDCAALLAKQYGISKSTARETINSYNKNAKNSTEFDSGYFAPTGTSFSAGRSILNMAAMGDEFRALLKPVGLAMITFGFMLGFFLPLIPFMRFMMGILGWMLLLFEAILAIPLLAIAHMKTDGDGIMGPMAQSGYLMILGLILRPILMVFGLILGLVAFNGVINLMNMMFLPASQSAMGQDASTMVSIAVLMLIYGSLVSVIANSAFKAVDILPSQVMKWIGAQMDSRLDDVSMAQSTAMGPLTQFGNMMAFSGGGRTGGLGGGAMGGGGNLASNKTGGDSATDPETGSSYSLSRDQAWQNQVRNSDANLNANTGKPSAESAPPPAPKTGNYQ